jgi:hypothetical protein
MPTKTIRRVGQRLGYERFLIEGKLAYVKLNTQTPSGERMN